MINKITLQDKVREIGKKAWQPLGVACVNDQVVRLAYMKGECHWHKHLNEDELFYVVDGSLIIQIENEPDFILSAGELAMIPKNKTHCPKSFNGTYLLMFEPKALKSQGN